MTSIRTSLFSLFICARRDIAACAAETEAAKSATVFDEVWKIVREQILRPRIAPPRLECDRDRYRPLVAAAPSDVSERR